MLFLNILVLIFEVLYYSMFMYYAKGEGKFWKYILLFSIVSIFTGIFNINSIYSYIVIILSMLFGIKYLIKIKTSLYDLFFIILMILIKLFIEFTVYILFKDVLNIFYLYILFQTLKIVIVFIFKNKIKKIYKLLFILWYDNNFYLRYLFSILMFIYFIFGILYLIHF